MFDTVTIGKLLTANVDVNLLFDTVTVGKLLTANVVVF